MMQRDRAVHSVAENATVPFAAVKGRVDASSIGYPGAMAVSAC